MNFFEAQDNARQSTGRLVFFFLLAVASIVVMTNFLVMVVFGYVNTKEITAATVLSQFDWQMFGVVGGGVIAIVALGSIYKGMSLSGGGHSIAEMLGGELIVDGTGDSNKQKILNVVEEMAIASGSPVPPVYLINEDGINAFAAGYSTSDAVIGVTRGCIEKLSRDELQGVIAHEFSHILNGDMRLNIKLIAILHGIMLIGLIGYFVMRSSSRSSRSSKNSGGGIVFLGLGMMIIGYSGTFFGNLIKAAVSRQREFLADASAVQFTRNPDGIGGALIQIGASDAGSIIKNPNSSEISHALFSQGFTGFLSGLFATHPPLDQRIKKILPNWDGEFETVTKGKTLTEQVEAQEEVDVLKQNMAMVAMATAMQNEKAFQHIGRPNATHLGYARQLIKEIPDLLIKAVHEPYAARAVIYFLVLDANTAIRDLQLKHLSTDADHGVYKETMRLVIKIGAIAPEYRLPLVDMALPSLRQLTKDQFELFKKNLNVLIEMDGRVSLFEWSIRKIVLHHLDLVLGGKPRGVKHTRTLRQAKKACNVLLSVLAYSSQQDGMSNEDAFEKGAAKLEGLKISLMYKNDISRDKLNNALDELSGLKPMAKEKLLNACGACAAADGHITPVEAELVRVIADTLECPVPPFIV